MKYLKVLDVSDIGTLSKDSVRMIVRSCVRIEHLNVSLCRDVDDECVRYIAEKARNLKILYMVACSVTDEGEDAGAAWRVSRESLVWRVDVGVRVCAKVCAFVWFQITLCAVWLCRCVCVFLQVCV